jgi:FAD:protein FMN transferase
VPKFTAPSLIELFVALLFVGLPGCSRERAVDLSGHTQGTTYSIHAFCRGMPDDLRTQVDRLLGDVNAQMSTYDAESTLSKFNASTNYAWQSVPAPLARVVAAAQQLARMSDGAFDVTVGPLVNAWGFGPGGKRGSIPSQAAVAAARSRIGFRHLDVRLDPPALRKTHDIYVDLSAIAQGYTADALGKLLDRSGCASYVVEIGGEVRVGRHKPDGRRWQVGIEAPDGSPRWQTALLLEDAGVSTSGDYRDYFEAGGRRYSHTMDPRLGKPVAHHLAAVTVVDASAMWADGYATLLDVLGPQDGYAFAEAHGVAARFVARTPAGFTVRATTAFARVAASDR